MTFEELGSKVLDWADARGILDNSSDTAQLLKAFSEMGELADAHNKNDVNGVRDGVGDVLVCLINYCAIAGTDLTECLELAYNEIKDRKGYLNANGVFVKES